MFVLNMSEITKFRPIIYVRKYNVRNSLFLMYSFYFQSMNKRKNPFVPANKEITDAAPVEMLVDEDEEEDLDIDIIY